MSKFKVVGIGLNKNLLLIYYTEDGDKIIDEKIAVIRWKVNPTLKRLVEAFAEIVSNYILGKNKNLDKLEGEDLTKLFDDLLDEDKISNK